MLLGRLRPRSCRLADDLRVARGRHRDHVAEVTRPAQTGEQAQAVRAHSSEQHIDELPAHIDLVNEGPTLAGFHALLDGALASVGVEGCT